MNFTPESRYYGSIPYTVTLADGTTVTAVPPALPTPAPIIGFHRRTGVDRLDLIAVLYLNDPTGFWRLCDANNSMLAGALAARQFIGIPQTGRR